MRTYVGWDGTAQTALSGKSEVQVVFENAMAPVTVPCNLLQVVDPSWRNVEKKLALKTMLRQPRELKRQLLVQRGCLEYEHDIITKVVKGEQVSQDTLDVFAAVATWSFGLSEKLNVKCVPTSLSMAVARDFIGQAQFDFKGHRFSEQGLERHGQRLSLLRHWVEVFETLVVPVYCKREAGFCQHWALLVIKQRGARLRY